MKVPELYMRHSLHLCSLLKLLIVSQSALTSSLYSRIKGWHKCCRSLSQKLGFLFAFQHNPKNSLAIPNQKEKLAEAYNTFKHATEIRFIMTGSQEETWGKYETAHCCDPKFAVCAWTGSWKKMPGKASSLRNHKSCWHIAALKTADTDSLFIPKES